MILCPAALFCWSQKEKSRWRISHCDTFYFWKVESSNDDLNTNSPLSHLCPDNSCPLTLFQGIARFSSLYSGNSSRVWAPGFLRPLLDCCWPKWGWVLVFVWCCCLLSHLGPAVGGAGLWLPCWIKGLVDLTWIWSVVFLGLSQGPLCPGGPHGACGWWQTQCTDAWFSQEQIEKSLLDSKVKHSYFLIYLVSGWGWRVGQWWGLFSCRVFAEPEYRLPI